MSADLLFGFFLGLAVVPVGVFLSGILKHPYRTVIDLGFFFVPSAWVWMGYSYRRRRIYEFLRAEGIRLENQERDEGFRKIKKIQERYP